MSSINPIEEYQWPFSIKKVQDAVLYAFKVLFLLETIVFQVGCKIPDDLKISKFDDIAQLYGAKNADAFSWEHFPKQFEHLITNGCRSLIRQLIDILTGPYSEQKWKTGEFYRIRVFQETFYCPKKSLNFTTLVRNASLWLFQFVEIQYNHDEVDAQMRAYLETVVTID